jgi:hypothetical protein
VAHRTKSSRMMAVNPVPAVHQKTLTPRDQHVIVTLLKVMATSSNLLRTQDARRMCCCTLSVGGVLSSEMNL